MAANDRIALDANFSKWKNSRGAGLTDVSPFNYYVIESFLKPYPVNDHEMRMGLVDKALKEG